jgi:hypothetical protein
MIVRERRHIAALARTASALDGFEPRTAEASEAALRSYMVDQRHNLLPLSRTQQNKISPLDMVRETMQISQRERRLSI